MSVWPDLAKFCHFGKFSKTTGKLLWSYLVFGKVLNLLWQFLITFRPFCAAVSSQIMKKSSYLVTLGHFPPHLFLSLPFPLWILLILVDGLKHEAVVDVGNHVQAAGTNALKLSLTDLLLRLIDQQITSKFWWCAWDSQVKWKSNRDNFCLANRDLLYSMCKLTNNLQSYLH